MSLNENFRKAPLEFFKRHPVVPPSDLGQGLVNLSTIYDETTMESIVKDTSIKTVQMAEVDPTKRLVKVSFQANTSLGEPEAVTFRRDDAGGIAMHFLPWRSMHMVSLKIPEIKHRDLEGHDERNPHFFFTAAINGCSVFVRGSPREPEIYHGGIDGSLLIEAEGFWRACLVTALRSQGVSGHIPFKEVNKRDYIKDSTFSDPETTATAATYKRWLQDRHRNELTIEQVSPWGCVFGIRYGALWSFYLQENATITTLKFVKQGDTEMVGNWRKQKGTGLPVSEQTEKASFLGIPYDRTVLVAKRRTTRPLRVRSFYPDGSARIDVEDTVRAL